MSRLSEAIVDSYRRENDYLRRRVADLELQVTPGSVAEVAASALHFADLVGSIPVSGVERAVALQNIAINIRHAAQILRDGA